MKLRTFNPIVLLSFCFPIANIDVWAAQKETSNLKKTVATLAVGAMALVSKKSSKNKVVENRKGETFTFHGDGTVSVKGIFSEDLGTHRTNNNNPLSYQNIELIKEGNNSGVFVGLGLMGGCKLCEINDCKDQHNCKYQVRKYSSFDVSSLIRVIKSLNNDTQYRACKDAIDDQVPLRTFSHSHWNKDSKYNTQIELNVTVSRTGTVRSNVTLISFGNYKKREWKLKSV